MPGRGKIAALAFYMGFAAALSQVILIRELLSVFRGNEYLVGFVFAAWFLGIYAGARSGPNAGTDALLRRARYSAMALPLVLLVSVYSVHILPFLFPKTAGTFYSFAFEFLASLVLALPVGFIVGYFFPAAASLLARDSGEGAGGRLFYIESAGSAAGGVLFSFVLVRFFNPAASAAMLLAAGMALCLERKRLVLIALPLVLLLVSGEAERRLFSRAWSRSHTGTLVHSERTKYQTVNVEKSGDTISVYGDGILLHTLPDRYEARSLFHLVESLRGGRKKVLVFGSGPGSFLHNLLRTDAERVDYFELDPDQWRITEEHRGRFYPGGREPSKLRVVFQDLRGYLGRTAEKYDMILCLAPPPENIRLNRFYTVEFYEDCRARLAADGIMLVSVQGFAGYISPERRDLAASLVRSFARVFPSYMKTSGETVYLVGAVSAASLPASPDDLIAGYGKKLRETRPGDFEQEISAGANEGELRMLFEPSQLANFDAVIGPLLGKAPENRDLRPGGYWNRMALSLSMEKSPLTAAPGAALFPLAALLLSALALADMGRRHGNAGFARSLLIYVTGFVSISVFLVLVILYQNFEGIVYHRIALMSALFMAGLAAGSLARNVRRILPLWGIFLLMAASPAMIVLYTLARAEVLFWAATAALAFCAGGVFPSLFLGGGGEDVFARAQVLDAMDHFGSIMGSLLTVTLMVPVLGIYGTLAADAVLLAAAAVYSRFACPSC